MDALLQLLLAAYKMCDKATVSYVKLPDGKIVNGSESVSYDNRTADPHLPDFVRDFIGSVLRVYPGL
ncbi:hypothetical protein [Streptomyces canus]|uniref:hypothetical protein n=1 Tax=Streptomyces canus TaxID=58343 RepID=UPI0030DDED7F